MTTQPVELRHSIAFGEGFELDLRPRRLRRDDHVLKLERIPLEILFLLVEHPGEIVTRDEIVAVVWGNEVFLDTDNSIRGAIRKIRHVLKDDPEQPRFIQTVTGRGYRFIAAVEVLPESTPQANQVLARPNEMSAPPRVPDSPTDDAPIMAKHRIFNLPWLVTVACLSLAILFGLWFWRGRGPVAPPIRSLAVLPLESLSGDSGQEYFTEGMTDELTTDLARITALKVISRTSAMQFRGTKKPLPEVGKELNADAVVEGTVERSGNRVRITARLIDARSDRHLWAESYERDVQDALTLQNEVAGAIANEIRVQLKPQEKARVATVHSINPDAEVSYLEGLYEMNKWTRDGIKKSFGYFQSAVQLDPSFAEAWSGLSDAYFEWSLMGIAPKAEALPKALAAARKALELDETLSEAHVSLATCTLSLGGSRSAASEEMKRAIELDPSNARAHQVYGRYLLASGLYEQSIAELKRAEELDPLTPKKKNNVGVALYFAQQYDEALIWFQQVPDPDLDSERRHRRMAEIYDRKGMQKEAIAEFVTSLKFGAKPDLAAQVERRYLSSGFVEAKKTLLQGEVDWAEKQAKAHKIPENGYWIARDYVELGESKNAVAWLATASQNDSMGFLDYKFDPQVTKICSDAHVKDLPPRLVPLCRPPDSITAF